ncbi:MAG: hypothetical protein AAF225_03165 [Pseudomonadota bacterium]
MADDSKTDLVNHRSRIAHGAGAAVGAFVVVTVAISAVVYVMGLDIYAGGEAPLASVSFLDTTSAAAFGVASGIVSLVFGLFGVLIGTVAAMLGVAFGTLGLAAGFLVAAGVFAGPVLLVIAIGLMVKRRYFPDVI